MSDLAQYMSLSWIQRTALSLSSCVNPKSPLGPATPTVSVPSAGDVEKTPGPGVYASETVHRAHHTKTPSFTFGSRPNSGNPVAHASPEKVVVPGPGHYHSSAGSPVTPRSARGTLNRTTSAASLNSVGSGSGQKPSSSFGTSPRFKSGATHSAGPGSYEVARARPMSKKGVKIGEKIQQKPREVFDLLYTPAVDTLGNRTTLGHSGRQK